MPSDSFDAVFGVDAPGDLTLLEALRQGGGGHEALGRHAVAALLNALNDDVDAAFNADTVIALVQAAYASQDFETNKDILAAANEQGCPIGTPDDRGRRE
jgi:hypothetical protein